MFELESIDAAKHSVKVTEHSSSVESRCGPTLPSVLPVSCYGPLTATHSVKFATMHTERDGVQWEHPVGGWQGGRGWHIGNMSSINKPEAKDYLIGGGGWYVENFFEALDQQSEFFVDPQKSTLYLIPNASDVDASGAPSAKTEYVAVVLQTLISINGTKATPVSGVTVQVREHSHGNTVII